MRQKNASSEICKIGMFPVKHPIIICAIYLVLPMLYKYCFIFQDRCFKASSKFSKFTYWNLEDTPSQNDKIKKAMEWINISSAVRHFIQVSILFIFCRYCTQKIPAVRPYAWSKDRLRSD